MKAFRSTKLALSRRGTATVNTKNDTVTCQTNVAAHPFSF